ncbi:uncharacterized protein LOC119436439 isoform X2 [Dermacentor silvarum]|uniref:uncharacterized protein LOC119436439 isoform X2 n=1 Tax=Dermacentor silvarum TaxID=543639 RepID=UPI001897116D|nr:uncharacterized protein LOC119436439 isoform X2 [Dermacentor silvarum]
MGDSRVDESSLAESSCFGMDGDTLMAKMDLFGKFRFLIPAQLESLREYEQHIISLRRDNLQLRLRLYFLVKQDQYDPTESNPETAAQLAELHEIVDTETKKISEALKERDALLDRYRKKVDELEQLLERAYQDKSEIDKELNKWKRVTNGCCAHGDGVQDDKHNNELEGEVKGQRFGELEDKDILSQKPKVKSKTKTQQLVSVHALKLEKTGESPNSQEVMWSSVQPRVEAFLQLIDDSLAAGDIEQARQAKEDFKRQLSTIADTCCSSLSLSQCPQEFEAQCSTTMQRRSQMSRFEAGPCNENTMEIAKSRYPSRSAGNHFVVPNTVTVRRGERSSLEAGYGNERLIDSLNNEIMHLKSRLHASQTRRRQLEVEVRSASQLHDTVCKQKDKLLESANMEIHELKRQAKEALVLKSRQAELESECNCLHAAIREKASFIEELLSERNKAVEETEKTLQDFLTSFKQKDESIKELEAKLNHFQKEAATPEKLIVRQQNLTDFSYEPRESLPAPYSVESTPERGGKVFFFASPTSPDGSDTATVLYLSQCTSEVKDLCQAVCELAQESKVLPELSTFNFPNSGTVPELIEILNSARERGLQFCMPSQSGVVNDEHLEDTGHVHNGPDASQVAVPIDLGEKLQQLSLLLGVEYSVLPVCLMDVVGVVDALIGKAKRESIHNSKDPAAFPGDPRPLKGQGQAACSTSNNMTSPHLSNECGNSEAADYQKELLGELDSALECVGELQSEVEALSLTPTTSMLKKTAGSTDELVFAVDSTGQLIPVPLDSVKRNEHFAMETSVQTEEADDDMESLRNELRNAKAQVKFLQRSLKDSFSVKITESPTGPNAQPLIEIDQNLPHHGSLASQSPRKSALSANRRWRKQLTNQKMSEFGLSENVFELQEEIFFLVLRIEDLERQLKESSEVMVSKHKDEPAAYEQSVLTDADLLEKNAALEQQLQDMQEMSVVLLCRLEELAKFLGQLLAYDETGSLGSVTLSSAMVAKIRQFVADSKEMSNSFHSFSLSFLGSDTSSILSDHLSKRGSLDKTMQSFLSLSRKSKDETADMNKPSTGKLDVKMIPPSPEDFAFMEDELKMLRDRVEQQQSEISTLTRRLEEECPERASSATGGRCPSRRHPGTPASLCEGEDTDASWRYQDQVVLVQASDSDDILLLLNERGLPENVYLRSTWQKQALNTTECSNLPTVASAVAAEEADADADYSSSSSPSLLRWKDSRNSALENNAPQEPLVPIGRFQCWSSDSDIWSEPDRSVSEQRMGGVCRKEWSKQPRRSPKEARKAVVGGRQEPGSDTGVKKAKDTWPDVSRGKRLSCPTADGGCSKRATPASYIKTREFEKLLRRIQQCGSRLEDTLALHKESCQKLLETALGESPKDATESRQLKQTDLLESHGNSMRKLEFRLEEMFINNQVLQELLTEHLASEKAVVAEASTPSGVGADARVNATEQLNQCKKELECKERREEILKRAIVREQNSKLHLEKELADSQKELQSIHEAHRILQEDYKALVERRADSITREPQHHLSLERLDGPTRLEQTKSSSIEKPNSEQAVVCDDNCVLVARVQQQAQEIARLGKEEVLLRDKVMNLLEEKAVLLQKLETAQHEHEVLAESTSNKISELVTKLGPLSTQNKNQQDEIKGLRERCDSLSREKVNLEFDIDRAFSKLEGLRVENQDLRDTLLALRKQESQLQEKLEKAMNELQATKKISDEFSQSDKLLRVEKDQLAAKIADLSSHVDGLQCEKQSLYEEKQRLILEVSAGEDEVERITSKLQNCEEECNNLRTQKIELEAVLQASTEKLEEYERLSEQLREEISATKLKLENMNSRCNHLEQELGASKEAHRQLMWRNDELQRTLEAVGREAQQSKSFLKMNADKQHMMAIAELDRKKSLQSAVTELELKLEKAMHENKCLRFELKAKEQFQVGSTSGAGNSNTSDASLRYISAVSSSSPPRLSPHQATPDSSLRQPVTPLGACRHSTSQSRSQHTSPDLGIDSDPTPEHEFYSAHADSMIVFKEHWQHRMRADWSFSTVHSAPDSIGGNCQPCQQGKDNASLWKLKANATCPAGDLLDRSDSQSPSKSGLPAMSCSFSSPGIRMCAIVQLSDHEQLKKRVDESICLIRRVEGVVEKALDALADFASDCTEPPECKSLLEDAEKGCQTIKGCLTDSFRLICSFTIAPVPEQSAFELQLELCKLREKDIKQTAELQSAHEEIAAFKEKKEGMEKAISRQLNKTKMVLKQTRGNLTSMRSRDCNPEKDPKAERNSKAEKK